MPYLLAFAQCLMCLVLASAAFGKVRNAAAYRAHVESLRVMRLLPTAAVKPAAALAVVVEIVAAILLVPFGMPLATTVGFVLSALLMAAFTAAVASVVLRGISTTCKCFGAASTTPLGRQHVARNAFLTAVAVAGAIASSTGADPTVQAMALAVPLGALVALLVVRLDDLVALFAPVRA